MIVKCQIRNCIYNDGDYCDAGEIIISKVFNYREYWECQTGRPKQRPESDRCIICGQFHTGAKHQPGSEG